MMRTMTAEPLVRALDTAGYRLTEPRRAVADLIAGRRGHFTAADLVAEAKARRLDIGRATIFRALELFTELNLVERLDLPNGEHAYVECARAHHHRSEEHTSELQSRQYLVCRLLLEKQKKIINLTTNSYIS